MYNRYQNLLSQKAYLAKSFFADEHLLYPLLLHASLTASSPEYFYPQPSAAPTDVEAPLSRVITNARALASQTDKSRSSERETTAGRQHQTNRLHLVCLSNLCNSMSGV